ncbi:hypothetical protein [Vulcanisaeta distributa]|uniref:hypothetical protein n=1 Tax=Vulcanisaeta distributa TaxID=164451 RepID=UPI001FB56DA4|nr:hypothetical protein [Vulcanisaeta distributa]
MSYIIALPPRQCRPVPGTLCAHGYEFRCNGDAGIDTIGHHYGEYHKPNDACTALNLYLNN